MPLTPIDESRGDRSRPPHGGTGESSVARRLWSRMKELLDDVPVGGSLFAASDDDSSERPTDAEAERVTGLPAQEQPPTAPAGNTPEYKQVEPICIETGTELTISLPDNPEATITSDVWERVER